MKNLSLSPEESRASHLLLGELGERLALDYLEHHGYRIIATNFVVPIGYSQTGRPITGEIDIIAYDETKLPFTLAFVEVKTRTRSDIATPEAAVDLRKQRRIIRAARRYRRLMRVGDEAYRYDVIGIVTLPNLEAEISHLRGYFAE